MINKNDILDVKIIDMGYNLEGIAKHDGVVLFVPNTIVGEEVKVQVINTKQKAYICKPLEVIKQSDYRITPKCPYFGKCGGCQVQHILYEKQLDFKTTLVQNAITNIGKLLNTVNKCVPCDNMYGYRNKLALPVNPTTKRVGMFRTNSHNIIDIDDCLIQEHWAKDLITIINDFILKYNISVYSDASGSGLIKHIVARCFDNQYLFTIVVNGNNLSNAKDLVEMLKTKFNNFGLNININTLKNNVILTNRFKHIYGLKSIKCEEYGVKYEITNASFMQVNNNIKHKMYDAVLSEIGGGVVVDAYSGAGLLSAVLSKQAKQVYGIEIVDDAVKSADELVKVNDIKNLKNICGDTAIELPKLANKLDKYTLVLDPPRKGCDGKVLETILKSIPDKIVYISCNPSTLARDLSVLKGKYDIVSITPYDMFPQTCHVETLAVLKIK